MLNDTRIHGESNLGMISPFNVDRLSPASYDVALHHLMKFENPDRGADWLDYDLRDRPYRMDPGEFILAATEEELRIPLHIACEFRLKSTVARLGFQHNLAIWIDPGFIGRVTLEISNVNRFHHRMIEKGMLIGQLVFHELSSPATFSYSKKGRYQNAIGVESAKPPKVITND